MDSSYFKTILRSLSPDRFSEAVIIFERAYLGYDVASVDGHGDGGCDIKIFQNGKERLRCVQITVNKNITKKLEQDLYKVSRLISDYCYERDFDFFCSIPLTERTINEFRKIAKTEYDIELNVFDGNRLSGLDCPELQDYLVSIASTSDHSMARDADIDAFLSLNECRNNRQFDSKIYEESDLTVSDLFIPPIYSLHLFEGRREEVVKKSDSVIADCKTMVQSNGLLLIKGPYGSGKTILTKAIIGEFRKDGYCVCFRANLLKTDFFSSPTVKVGIEKCINRYQKLYIFIDSCELLLADYEFILGISLLLDDFKNRIHFIINYRSIQNNETDRILEGVCGLPSSPFAVLKLQYFDNRSIQLWLNRYNNTRIGSGASVITYDDIQGANKNLRNSCTNPLILYMVSSGEKAKQNLLEKNWYGVFHEFIDKTIKGKFEAENDYSPFFNEYNLSRRLYYEFLAEVASLINSDSNTKVIISQATEDDFYLDRNEIRYSIDASGIEPCVQKWIDKDFKCSNTTGKDLVQILNCYFFEINEQACRFRDNNILFFFKAYKYTQALKEAIGIYDREIIKNYDINSFMICRKSLSSATSRMIIHPVEIEFILNFIKNSNLMKKVNDMIYFMISHGVILNIENKERCELDYDLIKMESLLCIIFMNSLKEKDVKLNYKSDKMQFFFKRLSQYHSLAKLVDKNLSSIIQRYFSNIPIAEAEFRRINLKNYNFNGSTINNTNFIQCKLDNSSIKNISCKNTTFDMCLISNIEHGNASVSGSITFDACKLIRVTILVNKVFPGTTLAFNRCIIDQMNIFTAPEQNGVHVLTTFTDCIIRQCTIKVDTLRLNIERNLFHNRIEIDCDSCSYYLEEIDAKLFSFVDSRCKTITKKDDKIIGFD